MRLSSRMRLVALSASAVLAAAVAAVGCVSKNDTGGSGDASFDLDGGSQFDGEGGGDDGTVEAATPEASAEAAPSDATVDVVAIVDAGLDTGTPDSGHDAAILAEAGLDATVEAGPDAGPEAGPDAGPEAGLDAGLVDATADAGADATGGDAAPASCITAVFGDHYLRAGGTAVYAGGFGAPVVIVDDATGTPLSPLTEIAQSSQAACGLRGSDGSVWCWSINAGYTNTNGALGNGVLGGTVPAVGHATRVVMGGVDGGVSGPLTGVLHLSTASDTFYEIPLCAIAADHTLWCWGTSTGQSSPPAGIYWGTTGSEASVPYALQMLGAPPPSDGGAPTTILADQVSVGGRHICVLHAGLVSCWGANVSGNLANGDPNLAFQPYPLPVVPGPYGFPATVDAIGSGNDFSCALAAGSVWCWGTDSAHQMGNPSVPQAFCNLNYCQPTPVPVQISLPDGGSSQVPDGGADQSPLSGIAKLQIGYGFGCALTTGGAIDCWGSQVVGSQTVPEAIPFTSAQPTTGVTDLAAAGEDWSALRYITSSGLYVQGAAAKAPYCL